MGKLFILLRISYEVGHRAFGTRYADTHIRPSPEESTSRPMIENRVPVSPDEDPSPDIADLCEAMFIEGARVLGFTLEAPISSDAQQKILRAANFLGEKLAILLAILAEAEPEFEFGN
jgi:hypothetical protein